MTVYITDANYKTRYGITTTTNDARITAHNTAASLMVDQYCGRQFGPGASGVRYFAAYDWYSVMVDDCYSITSVDLDMDDDGTYETNLPSTSYVTLPFNGVGPNQQSGWPVQELRIVGRNSSSYFPRCNRPGVKVSATFGWAAVPVDVVEATYQLAARLYGEVAVPLGVTAPNVEFGLPGSAVQPPYEVQRLLASYRRAGTVIGVA